MNDLVLDEECILIGILFKQMTLKPSIVKQLATEVALHFNRFFCFLHTTKNIQGGFNLQPPRKRYVDPTDKLILEEQSQRITLDGNIDINLFVTGIVMAVRGHEDDKGVFIVKDYCFKELTIPKTLSSIAEDKYNIRALKNKSIQLF